MFTNVRTDDDVPRDDLREIVLGPQAMRQWQAKSNISSAELPWSAKRR